MCPSLCSKYKKTCSEKYLDVVHSEVATCRHDRAAILEKALCQLFAHRVKQTGTDVDGGDHVIINKMRLMLCVISEIGSYILAEIQMGGLIKSEPLVMLPVVHVVCCAVDRRVLGRTDIPFARALKAKDLVYCF